MIVISRLSVGVLTFVFQVQLEFQCAHGCLEFFSSSSRVYCVVVAQKVYSEVSYRHFMIGEITENYLPRCLKVAHTFPMQKTVQNGHIYMQLMKQHILKAHTFRENGK